LKSGLGVGARRISINPGGSVDKTERVERGLALIELIRSIHEQGDVDPWTIGKAHNRIIAEALWDTDRYAGVADFFCDVLPEFAPTKLALHGLEVRVKELHQNMTTSPGGRPLSQKLTRSLRAVAGWRIPEDSLLGLLAIALGAFAIALDVERSGYTVYLGSIPVRTIQLGVAMVLLGADFFLRRSGLAARISERWQREPLRRPPCARRATPPGR
jgi:hypothetical protein